VPESITSDRADADAEVFVGIDWGNAHHQLCVLDRLGRLREQAKISHDVIGVSELIGRLRRHRSIVGIAIERPEGLLVETLQAEGHRLFCMSPKMSARARERYRLAPTKSDAFDAFVLADSLRHENAYWRPLAVASPALAELRALTRDRERLIWNQRDVENCQRQLNSDPFTATESRPPSVAICRRSRCWGRGRGLGL
jgi:Transposase